MQGQAKAIIISSVSGGGKTTVINLLKGKCPELSLALTATTRLPRGQEKNGQDYYFYNQTEFEEQIKRNNFLEYASVHGKLYGVPAEPVLEKLEQGRCVLLNIDVQGMQTIKKKLGKKRVLSFFLMPPSMEIWEKRLRQRNTDTEEQIRERIKQGHLEMQEHKKYDHVIINDDLKKALEEIVSLLRKKKLIFP